jgi:hypothetical protein
VPFSEKAQSEFPENTTHGDTIILRVYPEKAADMTENRGGFKNSGQCSTRASLIDRRLL